MWYEKFTNLNENIKAVSIPGTKLQALSVYKGKVIDWDLRNGPITNKVLNRRWLIDIEARSKSKALAAAGNADGAAAFTDKSRSSAYKDLLVEYEKQKKKVDSTFDQPHRVLGTGAIAAAGQVMDTAYEVIRRTNWLATVTGKEYDDLRFQAVNVINEESRNDLNVQGTIHDELLEGQPEIGDNQTPIPIKPTLSIFNKQIFADAFRYEFGMREKSDSQIDIEARVTKQIPGIMKKMINDKILAIINAKSSAGDVADWDTRGSGGEYTNDAAKDVEDAMFNLQDYGGDKVMIITSEGIRLYRRNVLGVNVETADSSFKNRSGKLPFNEEVTYYVDNGLTANTYAVISKNAFVDWYNGPKMSIAYKNEMTPAGVEGRILFHFNGVKLKLTGSAQKNNGFT